MKILFLLAYVLAQANVNGQLSSAVEPGTPVVLYNPTGSPLQTSAASDGSFQFRAVPSGHYLLRAPGYNTAVITVEDNDLNVVLSPSYPGPGVRVSGKVIGEMPGLAPSTIRTVTLTSQVAGPRVTGGVAAFGGTLGGPQYGTLEAWVRPDGQFEFPSVPSGSYILRSLPAAMNATTKLEVGEKDVRNVEITLPFLMEVSGRVILEGRDLGPHATVQAALPTFTSATGIHDDGSFKLRLTEGSNQVSITRLPAGLRVNKIAYGDLDITHAPLIVGPSTPPRELVITLDAIQGESGSLTAPAPEPSRTIVAGRVVVVDGNGQPYSVRPDLSMTFTHPGGLSGTTGLHADGTFSLALLDERYSTTIGNLPADYSVQSIRSGSIDLTRSLLAVDAKHVPDNILVVLQHHPHNPR